MKKWILFDLDGTLTDPMIGITSGVKYALSRFGIEVAYLKDLLPFIGPPLKDSFMDFYGMTEEQAVEAIAYYREYYGPKGLYENEVYPGVAQMLADLEEAGFDLAVATTKPTIYAEEILKTFGLRQYFTLVVGSEMDGRRSDKAEIIRYIMRRAQVASSELIMVGDRKYDLMGAKECEVDSIGVLYGYGSREELEEYGAGRIVETVADLEKEIFHILQEEKEKSRRLGSFMRSSQEIPRPVSFGGSIRFAVIGNGEDAEKFCYANRFGSQFVLAAVCADTMEEALAFASRKGRILCFEDSEELASWGGIDAAYISCPVKDRYRHTMTMLKAGKHVLCAAPMAETLEQAEEMFQMAQEKNLILLEGIPLLYAPAFDKSRPYIASLGRIRHATLQYCRSLVAYQQWKRGILAGEFDPAVSAGALMELGVYPVAAMIRLFGAPKSVHGRSVKLSNGICVTGTILMEYEDMIGEVIYSSITDSAMPSQLQGEDGSMLISEIDNIKDLRISRKKVDQSVHFEQSDNILHHETNAFIRMIHTGLEWEASRDISLETMRVLTRAMKE